MAEQITERNKNKNRESAYLPPRAKARLAQPKRASRLLPWTTEHATAWHACRRRPRPPPAPPGLLYPPRGRLEGSRSISPLAGSSPSSVSSVPCAPETQTSPPSCPRVATGLLPPSQVDEKLQHPHLLRAAGRIE